MIGWLRNLIFKAKKTADSKPARDLLDQGLVAIDEYLKTGAVKNDAVAAGTIKELISSLEACDEGIIQWDRLLVMKMTRGNDKEQRMGVFVRHLSTAEADYLEEHPDALEKPGDLLRVLADQVPRRDRAMVPVVGLGGPVVAAVGAKLVQSEPKPTVQPPALPPPPKEGEHTS